jgi:hypothetical protein
MSADLAAELAPYLRGLAPRPDLYSILRRKRRRRRILSAVAAASLIGVAAIPATHLPRSADRVITLPAGPSYTHANGVRGSLGGNQALLDEALRFGRQQVRTEQVAAAARIDAASLHPVFAERSGSLTYVLLLGRMARSGQTAHLELVRTGTQPWQRTDGGVVPQNGDTFDTEAAQKLYGEPFWVHQIDRADAPRLVILVPADTTATISLGVTVNAAGVATRLPAQPLTLHAGTALIDATRWDGPVQITLTRGRITTFWHQYISYGLQYTDGQLTAAAAKARGHGNGAVFAYAASVARMEGERLYGGRATLELPWGGLVGKDQCALAALRYPSGALYAEFACANNHGGGPLGLLPAGSFERTLVAWRANFYGPYAVLAPRQAVRAEYTYAGGTTIQVPLTDGFGYATHTGKLTMVRVYDAGGRLLDQRPPVSGQ